MTARRNVAGFLGEDLVDERGHVGRPIPARVRGPARGAPAFEPGDGSPVAAGP